MTEEELRNTLTEPQKEELASLKAMPEGEIDFTDVARLPRGWGKGAKRFEEVFRPRKQAISLRIDADLLEWLKAGGDGWQTRINALIREHMTNARRG